MVRTLRARLLSWHIANERSRSGACTLRPLSTHGDGVAGGDAGGHDHQPIRRAVKEVLIKHVNEILASQGKAIDQALQVTRHIVENYEEQGRLSHLHAHLNDRAWIGKWVIYWR